MTHTHTHARARARTRTHTHAHTHAHTRTHTHAHTHTCIYLAESINYILCIDSNKLEIISIMISLLKAENLIS